MNTENKIRAELLSLQDLEYKNFHSKLMPTVNPEAIIGIRMPILRKYAKSLAKTADADEFLKILPHKYYEENNLHMMLITGIKDYPKCMEEVLRFLPYIDNWATCDFPEPKCFRKNKEAVLEEVKKWIKSSETYTIRYGIGMLMRLFLDEDFSPEYLEMTAGVQSQEYYVNMMIAWYFATALAKQWDAAVPYIEQHRLSDWVHKKTIQKAVESYRITSEQKEYLKGYR